MTIKIEVTTPEKLAFSDEVDFVVAPASDGEIGILPGHTPLLTRLGVGEIRLKKGQEVDYLAVAGGFLEVHEGNRVSIFAETADMAHEINLEKEKLEADRARAQLLAGGGVEEFDFDKAEMELKNALIRLKVAQLRSRKGSQGPHIPGKN